MNRKETIEYAKKCFKDHEAKFTQLNEHTQEIEWGKPGTSTYYIRFLLNGNRVFICGDVGDAVYTLTERADIKKISEGYELGYFTGKLTASENGKYCFDSDKAIERLKEQREEYLDDIEDEDDQEEIEEIKEAYEELISLAEECRTIEEWNYGLKDNEVYAEEIDSDWYEWMPCAGNELRQSIVMYWVGLKMAGKQLGYEAKYLD